MIRMEISAKFVVMITALGVPAFLIFLGWTQQMTGYTINNPDMVSQGGYWMRVGVVLFVLELVVYILIEYFRSEGYC